MGDTNIEYGDSFGIDTFKREIVSQLGARAWEKITVGGVVPDIGTEPGCKCANMAVFMERLENIAGESDAKRILYKVRHGLKTSQSAWAREMFLQAGNLDVFIARQVEQGIRDMEAYVSE